MRNPTWTDAELLHHNFKVLDRPELAELNLSTERPSLGATFRFVKWYDITPPARLSNRRQLQPYVWCALCQEATHWKGWVAEHGDGLRSLIGQDCARRNGGEVIRLAARDFEESQRRADALKQRQAILPLLAPVRKALENWSSSAGVASVMDWRAQLQNLCRQFNEKLTAAAKASPPTLLIEEEVRDYEAEARLAARRGKSAKIDPIYKTVMRPCGKIAGAVVYAGPSPVTKIRILVERIAEAEAVLARKTDDTRRAVNTRELVGALALVRDVVSGAKELERTFTGSEAAFEPAELEKIVAWYNKAFRRHYDFDHVEQKGRMLIVDRSYGARTTARLPEPHKIELPSELGKLGEALKLRQ